MFEQLVQALSKFFLGWSPDMWDLYYQISNLTGKTIPECREFFGAFLKELNDRVITLETHGGNVGNEMHIAAFQMEKMLEENTQKVSFHLVPGVPKRDWVLNDFKNKSCEDALAEFEWEEEEFSYVGGMPTCV